MRFKTVRAFRWLGQDKKTGDILEGLHPNQVQLYVNAGILEAIVEDSESATTTEPEQETPVASSDNEAVKPPAKKRKGGNNAN